MTGTSKSSALKFVNFSLGTDTLVNHVSPGLSVLATKRYNYVSHFIFITKKVTYAVIWMNNS